ncbi:hypothetical protein C8R47DRAFT_1117727 [Mycena vitilis]|nr:hypothetical protein C8R47DRAFT_1117727 [Mycena vitilis]
MSTTHDENLALLSQFLRLPAERGPAGPPPIPLSLDGFTAAVYSEAALHYIDHYPFDRDFHTYTPKARIPKTFTPDSAWKEKARLYLRACVSVDRSALAPLHTSGPYDAGHEQQKFVRKIVFPRRWQLEELASEMLALVEFVLSETRTASAVATPMATGLPRNPTVKDQVRVRDENCRLTGVGRMKARSAGEDLVRRQQAGKATVLTLQVVHGLPFQMGETSFALVEALTGIKCDDWKADQVGNAFLAQPSVHDLFGTFRIYLEWIADGQILICGRTGAADPDFQLRMITNDRFQHCALTGEFLDTFVRPRVNTMIADIEAKYFIIHKFVGDVVWLCGGADLDPNDEEEDEEEDTVVSDVNIDALLEMLRAPTMDMVPREQDTIFGSCMVLKHRDAAC